MKQTKATALTDLFAALVCTYVIVMCMWSTGQQTKWGANELLSVKSKEKSAGVLATFKCVSAGAIITLPFFSLHLLIFAT